MIADCGREIYDQCMHFLCAVTQEKFHVPVVSKSENISTQARSSTVLNNICEDQPIYAHWFGIQMYNAYKSAKMQIDGSINPIKLNLDNKTYEIEQHSMQSVVSAIKIAANLNKDEKVYQGKRGLGGCVELRRAEGSFTCLMARALDRFIFQNEATGACLHHVPCRTTYSGHAETANIYMLPLEQFYPGNPVLLSDVKIEVGDFAAADNESSLCSVVGVEEGDCKHVFPMLIGIPSTPDTTELQLHVTVHKKFWKLVIARGNPWDGALLCTLKAGVTYLLEHNCLTVSAPFQILQPFKDMTNYSVLGPRKRVFLNETTKTVFKFYDTHKDEGRCFKPCLMRELIRNVKLNIEMKPESDDSRLYQLSYTYIEGNHSPVHLKSFIGVIKMLLKMHERDLVHGDIRVENMVFPEYSESCLIDFDFVGKNDIDLYTLEYNSSLYERHGCAVGGSKMRFIHDRYSLKITIENAVRVLAEEVPILQHLLDQSFSLRDIVTLLESKDS